MGPLARLNIVKTMGTPQAEKELAEFKQLAAGPVESSFYYHHARLVEALYGIEKIEEILADPKILDKHVRATAGVNRLEGAGQIEAPRGTLNHHYKVDENGKMTWANLVVATGHNNNAMNKGVLAGVESVREGRQVHRGRSQPHRGCGAYVRSVPELLHARLRPDAAGGDAAFGGWRGCGSGGAGLIRWLTTLVLSQRLFHGKTWKGWVPHPRPVAG